MPRERRRRGMVVRPDPTAGQIDADHELYPDPPIPEPVDAPNPPVVAYSEADVPATAVEAIAWMDAASSDEDHIARAETLAAANAGRRKPWASVSKATAEVLG